MQAILTKYFPHTNTRPARIKAICDRGSITLLCDYSGDKSHIQAAQALVDKFLKQDNIERATKYNPWQNPRICGQLPNGDYAHVFCH